MLHRTVLLLAAALFFLTVPEGARGQARSAGAVHLGLSGGANNAYIVNQNNYGAPELDYTIGFGAGFGLKAGYQFTPGFGLRTGLLYTRQGQGYEDTIGGQDVEKTVDLTYLSLPLLLDLRLGDPGKGFFFQIGPQLSFLLSADVEESGQSATPQGFSDEDLYQSTDAGVLFEFGPYIGLTPQSYLTLGLRGLYGLTDINADDAAVRVRNAEGDAYEGSRNAYVGLHLSLHYVLPVGR